MIAHTRNGAVASSRIDFNVIGGVSAPLRRNTRIVKISISDSRDAQPVTVKRRVDALNEHVASVIPGEIFRNFNEDWLLPSLRRFSVRDAFWGIDRRLLRRNFETDYYAKRGNILCKRTRKTQACFIDNDILTVLGKIFHKERMKATFINI